MTEERIPDKSVNLVIIFSYLLSCTKMIGRIPNRILVWDAKERNRASFAFLLCAFIIAVVQSVVWWRSINHTRPEKQKSFCQHNIASLFSSIDC